MNGWPTTAIRALTVTSGLALLEPTGAFVTVRQADVRSPVTGVSAPSISGDGRFVAFVSFVRLVDADTDTLGDVYVLDRVSGRVTIETESIPVGDHRYESGSPRLSRDGRMLVFQSEFGTPDGRQLIVVRDRQKGTSQLVGPRERAPNGPSRQPAISADGRVVVWASSATNLVDGADANGAGEDVYALDRASGTISRISVDSSGRQPSAGVSFAPTISADGRYVAFTSTSLFDGSEPAPNAIARTPNVFVRDTRRGTTTRVSVGAAGASLNGASYDAAISGTGRYVAFVSEATNAVSRDKNGAADVFLRDLEQQTTTLVSRRASGGSGNGPSGQPAISADGEVVVFQSEASDLICSKCSSANRDINLVSDVFLFRRSTGAVLSVSGSRQPWMEASVSPAIDEAGSVVAFSSRHPIDSHDTANDFDLFVWCDTLVVP